MTEFPVYGLALGVLLTLLAVAIALAVYRFLRGPSLPDRVVAVDLITALAITLISAYAILTDQPAFLDVAIVLALIAFLATVALARFIEIGAVEDARREAE